MSFPGNRIAALTLIVGPLTWCAGLLLRYLLTEVILTPGQRQWAAAQDFAGPGQLLAYSLNPDLVTVAYAVFVLGVVLLFPTYLTLAQLIGTRLAYWGATLVIVGLFARLYFAGADQTAFQLTEVLGVKEATTTVMSEYVDISYGPWRVPVWFSAGPFIGGALLAVAAWRTGLFGTARALLIVLPNLTWMGVLKAATLSDPIITALLTAILVPLALQLLHSGRPALPTTRPNLLSW
ncbi:hypothetical protein [Nonomuraea typhae]|uniref:ABC transporter permease n=1 Tax=Nonomuraea typhae TaxID=2603600 RepID=A0ABW7Z1J7_9ACTN